jgi:glycosyltransferase involved in cell wall biosynthesis
MKLNKQTFIVLIPGFAANEADSTCLPAQQLLIRKINKLFPQLEIIVVAFQYPFTKKEYSWFGNHVISFNGANKKKLSRLLLWLKIIRRLNQLNKHKNIIGIFSCWCNECALVGKYFSGRKNLKHYIWICGQDARASNKLVKIIRPNEESLIAISKAVQKEFEKNHHVSPRHIIENGIDVNTYKKIPVERTIDILGVGSLIPLKRFDILIDVVHQLKNIKSNIQAIICGKGPEKDKLESLIKNLQLEDNIQLIGEVDHDEVLRYMQRSKILLHPSSYEGFSGVCIEALYAGAHVISFCNPVEKEINHWHIAESSDNMFQLAKKILSDNLTEFSPVLLNDMERSANDLMMLYDLRL